MDDRRSSRLLIHCPVVLIGDHTVAKGTVTNLSASGCGVETSTILRTGTQLACTVTMPGQNTPMVVNLAAVRWTLGGKLGLEFLRIKAEEEARLRQLIESGS